MFQRVNKLKKPKVFSYLFFNKVFYLPHKAVFLQTAETTKLSIVYDTSSKPNKSFTSIKN